jgi:2-methylcitrate dehydratase PrpD
VSLQYSVAEALYFGSLGKNAYSSESRASPEILALARKVKYFVDPTYPGPGRFKGEVTVTLNDGRKLYELEEYNRGSSENPMTYEEIRAKFDENASGYLDSSRRAQVAEAVARLESQPSASAFIELIRP